MAGLAAMVSSDGGREIGDTSGGSRERERGGEREREKDLERNRVEEERHLCERERVEKLGEGREERTLGFCF